MRRLLIVLTAGSLLGTAVGCHHGCNCGGDGVVADGIGGHETLAGIVTARNWQPAYVNPTAPEATTPQAIQALDESENLPQPRRMPTGEPAINDAQPTQ
jgi:hypothetical protein